MIKKIISLIMTLALVLFISNPISSCENKYSSMIISRVRVHVLKADARNIKIIKEQGKIKYLRTVVKENNGWGAINASFYNMNNRRPCGLLIIDGKVISKNVYNRPYIVIGDKTYISDDKEINPDIKLAVGGGSYLLKNGNKYFTNNHFSKQFTNSVVRRTCIGINKEGKVLLVVIKGANIWKCAEIMKSLGCTDALSLDGGTSSQMYYGGKYIVASNRITPVVIVAGY